MRGRVPFVRAGLSFLAEPTEFLERTRAEYGDTFLLEAFGFQLFMTFAPAGLRRLYQAPEDVASFTEATRTLIGFKLPDALLEGDMGVFHKLFAGDRMPSYLGHMAAAVQEDIDALPPAGALELFTRAKLLVHRLGFRCWIGPEAASPGTLERLRDCFERLDPEEAFVRPHRIFLTLLTRKAPERRALRRAAGILEEIWRGRGGAGEGDLLSALQARHAAKAPRARARAVAAEVMILHLASLSNLYAALAWTLAELLTRPALREQVTEECMSIRSGEITTAALAGLPTLDACAYEAIRVAQRSLTLRRVLQPCVLDDGRRRYTLQPGVLLATMLSVTNRDGPGLDRFDPAHYQRGRPTMPLPTREHVSTFGHGLHACPGRRFAIAAIKIAVAGYLTRLELAPRFTSVSPRPGQLGAVARAAAPCVVDFRKRS